MHHRQGRNFQSGKVVHQLGQLACIVQVGVVVQVRRLLHPGKIGTGTEMPATAADQQEAQACIALHLIQRQDQLADHLRVEGVVLVRAIQPQRGETAWVVKQFYGRE
ncbi:hypothetical protein ALO94_200368 [Pseudomonas syringae pv. spinaceae]|uniref:Uncharacterized protein n=1 Tax=Pseudomonas syringae pv. spinaceae TaxID=264459 RepID=A0A0Q0DEG7_PSESX|nr:hypothetical protein ALO94_200368 [Pseudomonas syringae pv. spinaceae]